MRIVPASVSYHPVGSPPIYMEVQFLFQTESGKPYQVQTTTDGINYKDGGVITLPPKTKLSWAIDPRPGGDPWPQLVEQ